MALFALAWSASAQQAVEFQPKVGAIGARVTVRAVLQAGSEVRFGSHNVPVLREPDGFSFLVPPGAATAFIEVVRAGRTVSRSAVPFVVTGTSLVASPRLIGLKEAIDVFGYAEPVPEGARMPVSPKPVLKLDDQDVLTIGESPPARLQPAVSLGDAWSMANAPMCCVGMTLTARAPRKNYVIPAPTPSP